MWLADKEVWSHFVRWPFEILSLNLSEIVYHTHCANTFPGKSIIFQEQNIFFEAPNLLCRISGLQQKVAVSVTRIHANVKLLMPMIRLCVCICLFLVKRTFYNLIFSYSPQNSVSKLKFNQFHNEIWIGHLKYKEDITLQWLKGKVLQSHRCISNPGSVTQNLRQINS